jgi:hypothetical protein
MVHDQVIPPFGVAFSLRNILCLLAAALAAA